MNTLYILLIMIAIIVLMSFVIVVGFKTLGKKNKEIKELKSEIERINQNVSVLTEFVKKQGEIKQNTKKIEKEIQNAETEEEVFDIVNRIIHSNNDKLRNKTKTE